MIDDKYDLLSEIVKKRISKISSLTMTTDVWTDTLNTKSFLGITCHFFDNSINQLNNIIIGVTELNQKHNSDYLASVIRTVCEEWNIQLENVTVVITDNGKNISKAVTDIFGKNKSILCFAHTEFGGRKNNNEF